MDYIQAEAEGAGARVGSRLILPASFTGSPRYMTNNYHDAMTLVTKFGKPDLFITMTCNPGWREIRMELDVGESPIDRPDLLARVFYLKLQELVNDLFKKHVLGRPVAYVYSIEFQKRGLPHVHLLLTVDEADKIRTAEEIDKTICAEIPHPVRDSVLHDIVRRHMIHGPCGTLNPQCPCNDENNKCTKGFPKNFREDTVANVDGYPEYRRRANGNTCRVGSFEASNRWVVPYNAYLSCKYNCHINVELCSSIKAIKYIYKYIYKGHDRAALSLREARDGGQASVQYDEIKAFLDARYVSAPESVWRILEYPMQDKSHSVFRLAVHLPLEQRVTYREGAEQEAVENAQRKPTSLMAWFTLNTESPAAREFLYIEIPEHYTFTPQHRWQERRGPQTQIGRIYSVSPADEERFHLRLLLLHVRGARSFEHLRTVERQVHPTFKAAANALGLLRDDREWRRCLEEAVVFALPAKLRELFAIILEYCSVENVRELYNDFIDDMSIDYQHRYGENARDWAYYDIESRLLEAGRQKFGCVNRPAMERPNLEAVINKETERELGETMYRNLNRQQREVANAVRASLHEIMFGDLPREDIQTCFFVDGPGGSGKTYLYETLYHMLTGVDWEVLCVAWTGIAANLLPQGRTVHSTFKLPVPITPANFSSNLNLRSKAAADLKRADVIIWDEAPMAPNVSLDAVNNALQDVMDNELPFGGKIMILGGDFRQVSNNYSYKKHSNICCISSRHHVIKG